MADDVDRLVDTLTRLDELNAAVRDGSVVAHNDLATVLHLLVGTGNGYDVIRRGFTQLSAELPIARAWDRQLPDEVDGQPVLVYLRTFPPDSGPLVSLFDFLDESCLRFGDSSMGPGGTWSFAKLIELARHNWGGHVAPKPHPWLEELRVLCSGDVSAATALLWSAGEVVAGSVSQSLRAAGVETEVAVNSDRYLDGVELRAAVIHGDPGKQLSFDVNVGCAKWASGRRRALLGAVVAGVPTIFGLEADSRLSLTRGTEGQSLNALLAEYRLAGLPAVGRNEPCPCGSGNKFKRCHGKR